MTDSPTAPIRTCVATRKRLRDSELLRVVYDAEANAVIADPRRRKPGRGAWITPSLEALDLAEKRHAFARAFRVKGNVNTGHVRNHLADIADGPEIVRTT
nr:YlxR family protein [Corynebacterium yudongzhengii]